MLIFNTKLLAPAIFLLTLSPASGVAAGKLANTTMQAESSVTSQPLEEKPKSMTQTEYESANYKLSIELKFFQETVGSIEILTQINKFKNPDELIKAIQTFRKAVRQAVGLQLKGMGLNNMEFASKKLSQDFELLKNSLGDIAPDSFTSLQAAMISVNNALKIALQEKPQTPVQIINPEEDNRKKQERDALDKLALLRTAIKYYVKAKKTTPKYLEQLTPDYIADIPELNITDNKPTKKVSNIYEDFGTRHIQTVLKNTGGWIYISDKKSKYCGMVFIDLSNETLEGKKWWEY